MLNKTKQVMKLDKEKIWQKANAIYGVRKLLANGYKEKDLAYVAPEMYPKIPSNQVYAIMEAIVDAINEQNK